MPFRRIAAVLSLLLLSACRLVSAGEAPPLPKLYAKAEKGQWAIIKTGGEILKTTVLDVEYLDGEPLYVVFVNAPLSGPDRGNVWLMVTFGDEIAESNKYYAAAEETLAGEIQVGDRRIETVTAFMPDGARFMLSPDVMGGTIVKSDATGAMAATDSMLVDFGDGADLTALEAGVNTALDGYVIAFRNPRVGQWVECDRYRVDPATDRNVVAERVREEITAVDGKRDDAAVTVRQIRKDTAGKTLSDTTTTHSARDIKKARALFQASVRYGDGELSRHDVLIGDQRVDGFAIVGNSLLGINMLVSKDVPIHGTIGLYAEDEETALEETTGFGE